MYTIDFQNPCSVYFVGIGGISMSGLAEILLNAGFTVSGSDQNASSITDHLKSLGAKSINLELNGLSTVGMDYYQKANFYQSYLTTSVHHSMAININRQWTVKPPCILMRWRQIQNLSNCLKVSFN